MNNKILVEKFLDGQDAVCNTMRSINGKLFSYEACIAQYFYGVLIINVHRYSNSTAKQLRPLFIAVLRRKLTVLYVDAENWKQEELLSQQLLITKQIIKKYGNKQ